MATGNVQYARALSTSTESRCRCRQSSSPRDRALFRRSVATARKGERERSIVQVPWIKAVRATSVRPSVHPSGKRECCSPATLRAFASPFLGVAPKIEAIEGLENSPRVSIAPIARPRPPRSPIRACTQGAYTPRVRVLAARANFGCKTAV